MIQPLIPQEKADLNAWIAEHVEGLAANHEGKECEFINYVWYIKGTDLRVIHPNDIPNYADEWSAAGPLFDRYDFRLDRDVCNDYVVYRVFTDELHEITQGTTGPEAIAKAVKQYEEQQRGRNDY